MALDYSTLSDEELEAIANDDYSKLSDATLNAIVDESKPKEKSMGEKAATVAGGLGGMAVDALSGAYNAIPGHDVLTGLGIYAAAPHLKNKAGALWEGAKSAGRAMSNLVSPSAPVAPGPNPAVSPSYTAPANQPVKPSMIQQGSEYAKDMQRIAADKVKQMVGEAAPVAQRVAGAVRPVAPAAIGAGAMLYSPGLNANEDEELRRRRQMGFQGGR